MKAVFCWTQVRSVATLVSNCLIDLTDVTLAFEDANSKLPDDVSIVSVADVDTEERVDNSFVEILKLMF